MMPASVQKGLGQSFLELSVLNQLLPDQITYLAGSGQAKVISDGLKVKHTQANFDVDQKAYALSIYYRAFLQKY